MYVFLQNIDADSAAKPLEDLEERGNLYVSMGLNGIIKCIKLIYNPFRCLN